jgi:hypothetical protein
MMRLFDILSLRSTKRCFLVSADSLLLIIAFQLKCATQAKFHSRSKAGNQKLSGLK